MGRTQTQGGTGAEVPATATPPAATSPSTGANPPVEESAAPVSSGDQAMANVQAYLGDLIAEDSGAFDPTEAEADRDPDPPVYDERGNVRPRGTPGARPMTKAERTDIARRLARGEVIQTTAMKPVKVQERQAKADAKADEEAAAQRAADAAEAQAEAQAAK